MASTSICTCGEDAQDILCEFHNIHDDKNNNNNNEDLANTSSDSTSSWNWMLDYTLPEGCTCTPQAQDIMCTACVPQHYTIENDMTEEENVDDKKDKVEGMVEEKVKEKVDDNVEASNGEDNVEEDLEKEEDEFIPGTPPKITATTIRKLIRANKTNDKNNKTNTNNNSQPESVSLLCIGEDEVAD